MMDSASKCSRPELGLLLSDIVQDQESLVDGPLIVRRHCAANFPCNHIIWM
jgi:hypothetical protein